MLKDKKTTGQGSVPGERLELGLEKSSGLKAASSSFPLLPFPTTFTHSPPGQTSDYITSVLVPAVETVSFGKKTNANLGEAGRFLTHPPIHPSTHRSGIGRRELILSW